MFAQYGELQPISRWDPLGSLGHPSKFEWVSHLGSVTATAWHSSSGHRPKFAALNRGCHLHSAWRPLPWELAYILVVLVILFAACVAFRDGISAQVRAYMAHCCYLLYWHDKKDGMFGQLKMELWKKVARWLSVTKVLGYIFDMLPV